MFFLFQTALLLSNTLHYKLFFCPWEMSDGSTQKTHPEFEKACSNSFECTTVNLSCQNKSYRIRWHTFEGPLSLLPVDSCSTIPVCRVHRRILLECSVSYWKAGCPQVLASSVWTESACQWALWMINFYNSLSCIWRYRFTSFPILK